MESKLAGPTFIDAIHNAWWDRDWYRLHSLLWAVRQEWFPTATGRAAVSQNDTLDNGRLGR